MSTKHYCDRCKKEKLLPSLTPVTFDARDGERVFDLCSTCMEVVIRGIKDYATDQAASA